MNPQRGTNSDVNFETLLTTVRVQAALDVIPRLLGPKEVWAPWMRDNLDDELSKLPPPSPGSPQPRLLGSLSRMLLQHFSSGMRIDTLCFHEVNADDVMVTQPGYVDLRVDKLPELNGSDVWWETLPPSIIFNTPNASSPISTIDLNNSNPMTPPPPDSTIRDESNPVGTNNINTLTPPPPTSTHPGTPGSPSEPQPKRRALEDHSEQCPLKKNRMDYVQIPSISKDRTEGQAGPSKGKGRAQADVPVEDSPVCDACRSREVSCEWPKGADPSRPGKHKRACNSCASQKIRCEMEGIFSIRRPRGKLAASRHSTQRQENDLRQRVVELSERVVAMEKVHASHQEEKDQLVTRIARLELQVNRLKKAPRQP